MGIAALVLLTLGVLLVGFGVLSLGNLFNIGITKTQRDQGDLSHPKFQMGMVRVILAGFCLIALGIVLGLLA